MKSQQKGFTLVEVLIATGLLMAVAAVALHFITHFNRMGDRMNTLATMEESLRTSLNRIEREIIEAAVVLPEHPDDSSIKTDKNRMVLGIPIYTNAGFVMVCGNDTANCVCSPGSDGECKPSDAVLDIMVFEVGADNSAELLRNRSNIRSERLLFSIAPAAQSVRQNIQNQVIARDLMPKIASGTNKGEYDYLAGIEVADEDKQGTFVYLDASGNKVDDMTAEALREVSQIRVSLWAEKNHRAGVLTSRKEIEVRLRNWGEIIEDEEE